ncbi:MAG TPA: citrate (pro-3S)-lyase subunit beta [Clostridiaceae bacterium]|nr:citrate (pro-3S)-lyase subunit beta [Clostridiaceae bacterium]HBF77946.1 citrate (pro-3S)-lyase subunit beta [Clostridiaceae bacterium]HBG38306.1 citrate (pro-3S)-lyase subunit beta [Clostridiaceae bacterium]HBN28014.1 citrate (pro-3S)-lyase subunit beta [Clostridiaceae bacterium]HBX48698.1 citrate (pro-3S)-lyase subunit beta [Clostridiaceae bacterium]
MERLRRTMMFVPGSNPSMLKDAYIYGADSLMFDLEDAVAINEKDSARFLVYNAIKTIDYGNTEIVVRINGLDTPFGKDDIEAVVRAGADVIRLPKTERKEDILEVEAVIEEVEKKCGRSIGSTKMMAAVESPIGVINAYSIATSSKRLIGIALGAEDYVTNMKTKRYADGTELLGAREGIVIAARAAGIYALDTVYSNVDDEEGFRREVRLIKQLGFDGKSVINPRQIKPVHEIFAPTPEEIRRSANIIRAAKEAKQQGLGVISLNGKMIDKPIIDRADRILQLAAAVGLYKEAEEYEK